MGKQSTSSRSKKGGGGEKVFGKGNVTATQVAFIVDRYLSDNNFLLTRSAFRSEASSLLPPQKSTANQSAKSLLKLGDMLDGYIHLKAEKILLDQDKSRLEHEKSRVHNLLRGMQHVMNAYNGALPSSSMVVNPPNPTPPPASFPVPVSNTTPAIISHGAPPSNTISQHPSYSTPPTTTTTTTTQLSLKRRNHSKQASAAPPSKRSRTNQLKSSSPATTTTIPVSHHPPTNNHITPPVQSTSPPLHASSSSVVKCLFNPGPQTPSPSPTDKSLDNNQTPPSTNKQILSSPTKQYPTSTNRTVITSETIQLSPMKQVSYYSIERNHCISSPIKRFNTNRDHVKGRLDFDTSSEILPSSSVPDDDNSGGSPSQDDGFDFDLPNLDCLGEDFNFSDLLGDFDLDGFGPTDNVGSSPECLSGSPDKMVDGSTGDHELLSGMSSTFTEIQSEQDMNNISGPNSVTSVKSVTKCIKVFSPVKSRRSIGSSDQEIVDADVVA